MQNIKDEINKFCDIDMCKHIVNITYCPVYNVLHSRPILRNCPCQECIVRPVCNKKCTIRKEYTSYLITHLYEESKAKHIITLGKNKNIEQDFENIVIVQDPNTYDITLRM